MVYPYERRILWHPRHASKFAVGGGGNITLYEYSTAHPSIRHITSHDGMPYMRCFAWSPDQAFDDLVAVGMANGKVDLFRMEGNSTAGKNGVLTRAAAVTIGGKSSRACNVLAFSAVTPSLLASGLDKIRGDQSLVVWDLNTMQPKFTALGTPDTASTLSSHHLPFTGGGNLAGARIHFQTAAAEVVNALAFSHASEHLLLAGVAGRFLRLYDTRLGQAAAVAAPPSVPCRVHALAADPHDGARFACWGDGAVTLWDARHMGAPALAFSASDAGADGARPGADVALAEFAPARRGLLATLERDAAHVRFWDVLHTPVAHGDAGPAPRAPREGAQARVSKLSWTSPAAIMSSWTGSGGSQAELTPMPEASPDVDRMILANTWRSTPGALMLGMPVLTHSPAQEFPRPLTAFALVPKEFSAPGRTTAVVMNSGGDLAVHSVPDAPEHALWSNRGALNIGHQTRYHVVAPDELEDGSAENGCADDVVKRRSARSDSTASSVLPSNYQVQQVVDTDISVVMRNRVRRGYGIADPLLNASICREDGPGHDTSLYDIWTWIDHSQRILGPPESKVYGFSFAYQGILGIWDGFAPTGPISTPEVPASSPIPSTTGSPTSSFRTLLDVPAPGPFPPTPEPAAKRRSRLARRARSPAESLHGDFHDAVAAILARRGIVIGSAKDKDKDKAGAGWRPLVVTAKLPQRKLALELCTWDLEDESIQRMAKRWADGGRTAQAACWFVFLEQYGKAVDVLMKSKDESHFMLSGTVAAFASLSDSSAKRAELREHCTRLIPRLGDPYLRALLTRLTSDEWADVLDEPALPLRARLFIALHFLEDGALGAYLRRAAQGSELGALLLTGLRTPALGVLQAWLDRTGDVQSAAALAARVAPGKARDARATRWADAYRALLDSWGLFRARAAFDGARGALLGRAVAAGEVKAFEWAPRQVLLRCNYCSKILDGSAPYDGRPTVCPFCARALPRCSICLLTLRLLPDGAREAELHQHANTAGDPADEALVICQSCRHGGHAAHIMEWFYDEDGERLHKTCPVADCECACVDE